MGGWPLGFNGQLAHIVIKKCKACGLKKYHNKNGFYKSGRQGYTPTCGDCNYKNEKEYQRTYNANDGKWVRYKWRRVNWARKKLTIYRWNEEHLERWKLYTLKYRAEHPKIRNDR